VCDDLPRSAWAPPAEICGSPGGDRLEAAASSAWDKPDFERLVPSRALVAATSFFSPSPLNDGDSVPSFFPTLEDVAPPFPPPPTLTLTLPPATLALFPLA
jgi:hypothetical protein